VVPNYSQTLLLIFKKVFYSHTVDFYIGIYLYYFCLQYCGVLNTSFRYNAFFTYIRKLFLIIGIIFKVFLGPDKQLQVFLTSGCSVISDKLHHLSSQNQGGYVVLTANK